jgi:hypothetical protein
MAIRSLFHTREDTANSKIARTLPFTTQLGLAKGVSQRFTRNAVDFVAIARTVCGVPTQGHETSLDLCRWPTPGLGHSSMWSAIAPGRGWSPRKYACLLWHPDPQGVLDLLDREHLRGPASHPSDGPGACLLRFESESSVLESSAAACRAVPERCACAHRGALDHEKCSTNGTAQIQNRRFLYWDCEATRAQEHVGAIPTVQIRT